MRERYAQKSRHEGYAVLEKLVQDPRVKDYFVVTSNTDDMFQRAGFDSERSGVADRIWETEGNLETLQCRHGQTFTYEDIGYRFRFDPSLGYARGPYPMCMCETGDDRHARPNIMLAQDTR